MPREQLLDVRKERSPNRHHYPERRLNTWSIHLPSPFLGHFPPSLLPTYLQKYLFSIRTPAMSNQLECFIIQFAEQQQNTTTTRLMTQLQTTERRKRMSNVNGRSLLFRKFVWLRATGALLYGPWNVQLQQRSISGDQLVAYYNWGYHHREWHQLLLKPHDPTNYILQLMKFLWWNVIFFVLSGCNMSRHQWKEL